MPVPDPVVEDSREQILLSGDLPSPAAPPSGCRFHTRCPWRQETRCDDERPQLRVVEVDGVPAGHKVACHFAEEIERGEIRRHAVETVVEEKPQALRDAEAAAITDEIPFS